MAQPTKDTYEQLDKAYRYFNKTLFENTLPSCLLVLHRKRKADGHFGGDTWRDREGKTLTDEIALNPETFETRSLKKVLSTLVHEMCHLQQHHFGKTSRRGYHNKEWAQMMETVGLIPTDTGLDGGKKTGQNVDHFIEPEGRFEKSCARFLENGFTIPWQALVDNEKKAETAKKKAASKMKYTCASCDANAWAKLDTKLVCGHCMEQMLSENTEEA